MRTHTLMLLNASLALPIALLAAACTESRTSNGPPAAGTTTPPAAPSGATTTTGGTTTGAATDTFDTSAGPLKVTPIHHASVLFEYGGKEIYVDPWTEGKLDGLPKADYIFITDIHPDHLDAAAIDKLKKDGTILVGPPAVNEKRPMSVVLKNGESHDFGAFKVDAIPMYNLTRGPEAGKLFHDKGRGDGYVITFGDKRVYLSGDTECTPEMKALTKIDVAFVCMNLPYTMPPSEAAECVKAFKPKVVFPYHFRGQDPNAFAALVKAEGVETRVRSWY
jgi:L-ascorbate metabolism protein UlaG (beta-lactamase superfamily)